MPTQKMSVAEYKARMAGTLVRDQLPGAKDAKPPKYNNKKEWDEALQLTWDSQGEKRRGYELMRMRDAGIIHDLEIKTPELIYRFKILGPHGTITLRYKPDYRYKDATRRRIVVEDFKGVLTPRSRLQLRLMRIFYNIDVKLTTDPRARKTTRTKRRK